VLLRLFQASAPLQCRRSSRNWCCCKRRCSTSKGSGRQLDPDLDLYTTAKPFLERWMNEQIGWRGLMHRLKHEAPRYAQMLPELPRLVHQRLLRPPRGADSEVAALRALLVEQRRTNRLLQAVVFGGIGFVAGAVVARMLLHMWAV
jgi:ubiquinone biosynthesis protein